MLVVRHGHADMLARKQFLLQQLQAALVLRSQGPYLWAALQSGSAWMLELLSEQTGS